MPAIVVAAVVASLSLPVQYGPGRSDGLAKLLGDMSGIVRISATAALCGQRTPEWVHAVSTAMIRALASQRAAIAEESHVPLAELDSYFRGVVAGQSAMAGAFDNRIGFPRVCTDIAEGGGWSEYLHDVDALAVP